MDIKTALKKISEEFTKISGYEMQTARTPPAGHAVIAKKVLASYKNIKKIVEAVPNYEKNRLLVSHLMVAETGIEEWLKLIRTL